MEELLIVRSAPFQQLDSNMAAINQAFPNHRISILTHEHGISLASKYKSVAQVYVYPHTGGFAFRKAVPELKDKRFEAVVVPVTNITGAGFLNVLLFSLTLKAKRRFVCNLVSDIRETSSAKIVGIACRNAAFSACAYALTGVAAVVLLPLLPLRLNRLKKK